MHRPPSLSKGNIAAKVIPLSAHNYNNKAATTTPHAVTLTHLRKTRTNGVASKHAVVTLRLHYNNNNYCFIRNKYHKKSPSPHHLKERRHDTRHQQLTKHCSHAHLTAGITKGEG